MYLRFAEDCRCRELQGPPSSLLPATMLLSRIALAPKTVSPPKGPPKSWLPPVFSTRVELRMWASIGPLRPAMATPPAVAALLPETVEFQIVAIGPAAKMPPPTLSQTLPEMVERSTKRLPVE